MVNPADTLVVMIEAAAGLAGFAGIVATLRRDKWTDLDKLQISNLLSCAFSALFVSILALVLLHADIAEALAWRVLSGTWFVIGLLATTLNAVAYRKLGVANEKPYRGPGNLFWFGTALMVLALQIYNVMLLASFWPVLVGISWLFGLVCYSFWQLLIRHK